MDDTNELQSLSHAIEQLKWLEEHFFDESQWTPHRFPFGLWFRGHSRTVPDLQPRAFRPCLPPPDDGKEGCWDETNVYEHLKLRLPSHERTYHSPFDWLCLMQHYSVPTRLLDWSESILSALCFAVKDDPDAEGELVVLNAKHLNHHSKRRPTISTAESGHVVIRAEMATTRSLRKLQARETVRKSLNEDPVDLDCRWLERCRRPVAVFPRRLNDRMVFQTSVFTLHGGKVYSDSMLEHYREEDRIPSPITLQQVHDENPEKPVLKRYGISVDAKKEIRDSLFRLGIHEGSMFPEIDQQRPYLQRLWWYENKPPT
jgi:hypothetical protein